MIRSGAAPRTPTMPRSPFLLLVALAFVGCGEEPDDLNPASATAAPALPSPTAVAAEPAAAVEIKGFAYLPARVTVRRGGEVTWTDRDASNHTVTFEDEGPEDIGNIREGRSATVTFEEPGTYAYVCEFHPGMAGTVEVE